jgi:putative Mn2+ efflux pump MntP
VPSGKKGVFGPIRTMATDLDIFNVLGIAVGLAMDAFAVAVSTSLILRGASLRQTARFAFHFLMPIVGWAAGVHLQEWAAAWDHWVAFGLLGAIGVRCIASAAKGDAPEATPKDPTRGWSLVLLSVATSVDALAVGLSFAFLEVDIWYPSAVIGFVAAGFTALGMRIGGFLGPFVGRQIEIVGGAILIGIGVKILAGHVFL